MSLDEFMLAVFDQYSIRVEELAYRTYLLGMGRARRFIPWLACGRLHCYLRPTTGAGSRGHSVSNLGSSVKTNRALDSAAKFGERHSKLRKLAG